MNPSPRTFGSLSQSRRNHFDLLRLVFALAVLYSHSFVLTGTADREMVYRVTHGQISASTIALFGFFLLSGYLIAGSYDRSRSLVDFTARRLRRIFPGFVVAVMVCFLIAGPIGADSVRGYFHDPTAWNFLTFLLLRCPPGVSSVFRSNPDGANLNGSLWTIRLEMSCYLLTAVAGRAGVLRRRGLTLLILAAAIALTEAVDHTSVGKTQHPFYVWGMAAMTVPFALGTTAYVFREYVPVSKPLLTLAVVGLVVTAFEGGLNYALWFAGGYTLLLLGLLPGGPELLRRVGDLSYGLYLYAFPIQQLIVRFFHPGPWGLTATATPIALALAWVSWTFVERPLLHRPLPGPVKTPTGEN